MLACIEVYELKLGFGWICSILPKMFPNKLVLSTLARNANITKGGKLFTFVPYYKKYYMEILKDMMGGRSQYL